MIICPRCKDELTPGHDCGLKLNRRRFFFGLMTGAIASAFPPDLTSEEWKHWRPDDVLGPFDRLWAPPGIYISKSETEFEDIYGIAYGVRDERRLGQDECCTPVKLRATWSYTWRDVAGGNGPIRLRSKRVGQHRIVEAILL